MTGSCPYTCRYCPDELHTRKHLPINIDNLKTFFNKFSNRRIVLTLTGGECTTHPQFIEVLTVAKGFGIKVCVDSNSVRTARFYQEVKDLVDSWNFTLHPSQHTLDIDKIKGLTNSAFVVVFVSMDPLHWDTAVNWHNQLLSIENIKLIPMEVISNWGGVDCNIEYTKEQRKFLIETKPTLQITDKRREELSKTHSWLLDTEATATFEDGSTSTVDPFAFIKESKNYFKGWKCYAGYNAILLWPNESALWANCGIKTFNHYLEIEPEDLKNPIVCTLTKCNCGTDIRSTKFISDL
jgi:organic radical activating enzyme